MNTLLSGGGTFNTYLISRISHYAQADIIIPDDDTVNFKEAIIFDLRNIYRSTELEKLGFSYYGIGK